MQGGQIGQCTKGLHDSVIDEHRSVKFGPPCTTRWPMASTWWAMPAIAALTRTRIKASVVRLILGKEDGIVGARGAGVSCWTSRR